MFVTPRAAGGGGGGVCKGRRLRGLWMLLGDGEGDFAVGTLTRTTAARRPRPTPTGMGRDRYGCLRHHGEEGASPRRP